LARGECLTLPQVLALGLQLAQALDVLHRRGALHLALRPEAVLWDGEAQQASLRTVGEPAPQAARLAYIAPEQTGRMERSADARSDLYALGILLYELLTGAPPFRCDDALAQIHWHIAGLPRPPAELDARLPAPLSQLVMKLLAKTPEERYQSAASLAQDLAECQRQWQQAQRIEPFALARGDLAAQLAIAPRLYGREREVHLLVLAFEQATRGEAPPTLLLVEGGSGIGKTALIQQLVRPIERQQG
jgi:serine/threonine protein kinase